MGEKINILQSDFYKDYFEDACVSNTYLLDKKYSQEIWVNHIDNKNNSYFKLSDDNWIIAGKTEELYSWIDDYNNEISDNITDILNKTVDWFDSEIIFFCISKYFIIESSWIEFKKNWIYFISCDDECPIIFNHRKPKEVFVFYPTGRLVVVSQKCVNN